MQLLYIFVKRWSLCSRYVYVCICVEVIHIVSV